MLIRKCVLFRSLVYFASSTVMETGNLVTVLKNCKNYIVNSSQLEDLGELIIEKIEVEGWSGVSMCRS